MAKRVWRAWVAGAVCGLAMGTVNALDFYKDGGIDTNLPSGYPLQSGDRLAGYPLFFGDGNWLFVRGGVYSTTGPTISPTLPWVMLRRAAPDGSLGMLHHTTVNGRGGDAHGWNGNTCTETAALRVNRIRGMNDRCALAQVEASFSDWNEPALILTALETNSSGRYYESQMVIRLKAYGLTATDITAPNSPVHQRLAAWLPRWLDAVVLAAGFHGNPETAFDGLPDPEPVLRPQPSQ